MRLRFETRAGDRFLAVQAESIAVVVESLQGCHDLPQQDFGLFATGERHLLLLDRIDARYPADRLLIQRYRARGLAAAAKLVFEFAPLRFECASGCIQLLLFESLRRHGQEGSAAGCATASMPCSVRVTRRSRV